MAPTRLTDEHIDIPKPLNTVGYTCRIMLMVLVQSHTRVVYDLMLHDNKQIA